ncbi:MAG: response regulator, partial [Candidatus Geothermincolia bacterium]
AREALADATYDVVTLDYQLPDCSGLDLLDEITAIEHHPPVVMITGHGDEELAYLSFRMGASGYAAKNKKLSVVLPDAVEWAIADATMKKSRGADEEDARLEGLVQATHATSRDLRLELDAVKTANQRLDKATAECEPETTVRVRKAMTSIEKSLARSQTLIDKLDSMVAPSPDKKADGKP